MNLGGKPSTRKSGEKEGRNTPPRPPGLLNIWWRMKTWDREKLHSAGYVIEKAAVVHGLDNYFQHAMYSQKGGKPKLLTGGDTLVQYRHDDIRSTKITKCEFVVIITV